MQQGLSAPWEALVVDQLIRHKRNGLTHDEAWALAERMYPPRGRDVMAASGTLFDPATGDVEISLAEFLKTVTRRAWHDYTGPEPGQGKYLRFFTVDIVAGFGDESEFAARSSRVAA